MTKTTIFLTAWEGDDVNLSITVVDSAGVVVDITGATPVTFKVAVDEETTPVISKTLSNGIVIPGGSGGIFTVALSPADMAGLARTAHYYHESIVKLTGEITHVVTGTIWIRPTLP